MSPVISRLVQGLIQFLFEMLNVLGGVLHLTEFSVKSNVVSVVFDASLVQEDGESEDGGGLHLLVLLDNRRLEELL